MEGNTPDFSLDVRGVKGFCPVGQARGFSFFPVVLLAAALAAVVVAALTTWWVLLALIPLMMMLGCVAMMGAHGRMHCAPSAGHGCCVAGAALKHAGVAGSSNPDAE